MADTEYQIATFSADVTVPIGHALMGGGCKPAKRIVDPLLAKGFILLGADSPVVVLALDWCQLNNDAYDRWRNALAETVNTDRTRILVANVHQHDAPIFDLTAQRLLDEHGLENACCDPIFHEQCVQRVCTALRESLESPRRITHIGIGQAKVERVASNRRVVSPDGKVGWPRNSSCADPAVRDAPVGVIDPWLKTISFWDGSSPVLAMSCYATHPMSYYNRGGVSWDFVGRARQRRQADDSNVFQIYLTGASGDIVAGKYNDGSVENRAVLADRIYQAMVEAWQHVRRHPLRRVECRVVPLRLPPRTEGAFDPEAMRRRLADPSAKTWDRICAAFGLSWHARVESGQPIDLPVLDLGEAQLVLLPGESFVEYQRMAQRMRPDSFVVVAGFAECAPGYVPTDQAAKEGFNREHYWCWVAPGCERPIREALEKSLRLRR